MGRSSPAEDQSGNQYALDFPLPTVVSRGNIVFIFFFCQIVKLRLLIWESLRL